MNNSFYIKYFDEERQQEIRLPLEEMVGILLAQEMDINFHIEALKAQAIVLRTNILSSSNSLRGKIHSNSFEKVNIAVKETKGMVITYKDKLIDGKYHLVCGGSTDNSENVIDNQVTYLRRVLCDYCDDSPYLKGEKSLKIEDLERMLKLEFPTVDEKSDLEILGFIEDMVKDEQGRVLSIKVGGKTFRGKDIKELLGLDSTRFSISPAVIKFISKGKGHGLGLCQYGAEKMAKNGASFIDILKYYYTGVDIKKMAFPSIKKPLLGKKLVIDPGHGGEDHGYIGIGLGLSEKDIVLNIALKLKERLEELGADVHLTRKIDEKVLITNRADKANKIRPNFFISLHMDYYPNSNIVGCEMFYFRNDMESKKLGDIILNRLKQKGIPTKGTKEGNFFIFRGVNVSSLLIELGYLSNMEEEFKFKDEKYIKNLIEGIEEGILEYFEI